MIDSTLVVSGDSLHFDRPRDRMEAFGAVRVVDNVPIGPAAVGSALSNVGYGVTRLMEQAFSTPAMTEKAIASRLNILMLEAGAELGAVRAPERDAVRRRVRHAQRAVAQYGLVVVQRDRELE